MCYVLTRGAAPEGDAEHRRAPDLRGVQIIITTNTNSDIYIYIYIISK